MLSDAERAILNTALGKYQPGQSEPILVGGKNLLKPASIGVLKGGVVPNPVLELDSLGPCLLVQHSQVPPELSSARFHWADSL